MTGKSEIYDASGTCGVRHLIVSEDPALEDLLFTRTITGAPFWDVCLRSARALVRAAGPDSFRGASELVLLSKGLLYQLQAALVSEFDFTIPVNLMATSRVAAGAESSRVVVSYSQVDAGGSSLVIADTVASGSTVLAALEEYRRSNVVDSLMVLSFAGSAVGARKIDRYCQAEGIECKFVYGLAAFGLAPNGFDLSFLHPDTVTSARYVERASALFGGVPVSAVGWDFGSQAMAPEKYGALCWLEAEYWGMHGHPEFRLERRPEDFRIVEKEHSAFDR